MSGVRFRTRIYAFCYIKECELAMSNKNVIQLPDPSFEGSALKNLETTNSYLYQVAKILPLIKVCRRIASEKLCQIIPPKERLSELERAWAHIPVAMKFQDQQFHPPHRFASFYNIRK
jgi:hypothetical protein